MREVRDDDDFGTPDDSRHGGVEEAPGDAGEGRTAVPRGDGAQALGSVHPEHAGIEEAIAEKLADATPEQVLRVLTAAQSSEWSGLLPPPSEYNRYPEDARRKMLEWNDAQILDASRRNDGLARGEIAQGRREQWFSFILNIAFLGAAFFSFAMTQNAASFGFLAVPGVTIAVNLYRGRRD